MKCKVIYLPYIHLTRLNCQLVWPHPCPKIDDDTDITQICRGKSAGVFRREMPTLSFTVCFSVLRCKMPNSSLMSPKNAMANTKCVQVRDTNLELDTAQICHGSRCVQMRDADLEFYCVFQCVEMKDVKPRAWCYPNMLWQICVFRWEMLTWNCQPWVYNSVFQCVKIKCLNLKLVITQQYFQMRDTNLELYTTWICHGN